MRGATGTHQQSNSLLGSVAFLEYGGLSQRFRIGANDMSSINAKPFAKLIWIVDEKAPMGKRRLRPHAV